MTKEYECKKCKFKTTRKGNYERHLKTKRYLQEKKETKIYKCDRCKYQTKDSSNWRRHKKSSRHKKAKKKPTATRCDLCEKDFASAQVCQVHMYRHYDKKQLLGDIFRMKGKLRRMEQCPRKRWFGVNDRNNENTTAEKTRLSNKSERVAKCKRQLAKMIDLYENNKRAVPTTITDKEIDIMAKERDEIMERMEEIEDDTDDYDALFHNNEYTRLEEREKWLNKLILKHRYGFKQSCDAFFSFSFWLVSLVAFSS